MKLRNQNVRRSFAGAILLITCLLLLGLLLSCGEKTDNGDGTLDSSKTENPASTGEGTKPETDPATEPETDPATGPDGTQPGTEPGDEPGTEPAEGGTHRPVNPNDPNELPPVDLN